MSISNFFKKSVHLFRKIASGTNPVVVVQAPEKWDVQYERGKWDYLLHDEANMVRASVIARLCAGKSGSVKILDVGAGNGVLIHELFQQPGSFEYHALDVSSAALRFLQSKYPAVHVYAQKAEDASFSAGMFDVIVFNEVLYYTDYKNVLARYRKYLKPEGFIIVSMYKTWRTSIIWSVCRRWLVEEKVLQFNDIASRRGWTVKVLRYK